MRLQLLHAERNSLFVAIDLEDLRFDFLADGEDIGGIIDPRPRDLADVQQAVHTTKVDEGAVVGQAADGAVNG
jgi:hypothetical protein